MVSMPTTLRTHGWTRAELAELPDDGLRYEIIDGELFVSAAPSIAHQTILGNLHLVMRATCPADLKVLFAPTAVGLAEDTEVQPDLLVAPRSQFTDKDLPGPPLLAVEILSPSTRRTDRARKFERYQRAGVASYWIIDPHGPTFQAWELSDAGYELIADLDPDTTWTATAPFEVEITPGVLAD
jgi:Uma2 family endonuclease